MFVVYGALAAGVCEEVGRFFAMRMIARRAAAKPGASAGTGAADRTSLAYGLGHGGAEAWLAGVVIQVQWLFFAWLANRGELDAHLSNVPVDALIRVHLILGSLSPAYSGGVHPRTGGRSRLSDRVVGADVARRAGRVVGHPALAIVLHALIDLPAALFQAGVLPLLAVDGIYGVVALGVAVLLIKLFRRSWLAARAA